MSEKYTALLASVRSKTSWYKLLILMNLHFLKTQHGTEMVRSFSLSLCEKTSIYPDSLPE